jgi:hypothetical protein
MFVNVIRVDYFYIIIKPHKKPQTMLTIAEALIISVVSIFGYVVVVAFYKNFINPK